MDYNWIKHSSNETFTTPGIDLYQLIVSDLTRNII